MGWTTDPRGQTGGRGQSRSGRLLNLIFERHFVLSSTLLIALSVGAVAWQLETLSRTLVQNTALRDAAAYDEVIREFRTLYTSEVVNRARDTGVRATHDYRKHAGAIPLPATMSMLLGERLGIGESQTTTRLYSDYPFPWNKEGGPKDDFERDALEALRSHPDQVFYRFEELDGNPVVRYATADRMRKSCIQCHNTHPQSPRTDWREGDVRGVLTVCMQLDDAMGVTTRATQNTLFVLAFVGAIIVTLFAFTIARLRRQTRQARQSEIESARKTAELVGAKHDLEEMNGELQHRARDLTRSRRAAFNLFQDMRQAKEAAEEATRAKSQFLANMSHEIRTPMTAILGFAETLVDNVKKPENVDAAMTIHRNGEHLLHVINDILDLSKVESGKFQMERIACSPHELLVDVQRLMQVRAEAKGLRWTVRLDGPLPETISSDPTRLRQILINLVGNAIKFTELGAVELTARAVANGDCSCLVFEVIDTGIGMSPDEVSRLFQPFAQADASMSRRFGGTGLGLTISKRFAEMLGGDIQVQSTAGAGSTFTLAIEVGNLDGVPMSEQLGGGVGDDTRAADNEPLRGFSILLVEDGPDNQRLISFVLRQAGADVTIAENGAVGCDMALQAASRHAPFDVILMDMQMPLMDGYSATSQLRKLGYEGLIIAVTAHAMSGDQKKCLDAGCDDFTTKPIDRRRLIEIVLANGRTRRSSNSAGHEDCCGHTS